MKDLYDEVRQVKMYLTHCQQHLVNLGDAWSEQLQFALNMKRWQ